MPTHADLITRFYTAFGNRDADTMAACYAPEAHFSDPVFQHLRGAEVGGMWRMLCARATDLRVRFGEVTTNGDIGAARWEAWYTYSATGRPVHNVIRAAFRFERGLIAGHVDSFDLYRWTRQALGVKGALLGWTPLVQGMVRRQAGAALTRFLAKQAAT